METLNMNEHLKLQSTLWRVLLLGFVFLTLQACSKADDADKKPEGTPVSISGYNYTIEGIQEFYVNGEWGGGLGIGAGYDMTCCVMLPDKWTPGLSATVEWRRTDCKGDKVKRCPERVEDLDKWPMSSTKKVIPIEPYDRPNAVQVMFLPNDEVKIYVVPVDPDHPDHPAKLGRPHPIGHPEHPDHPDYKPSAVSTAAGTSTKGKP